MRCEKRGAKLYGQSQFSAAADAYLRATDLRPNRVLNYYNLGMSLYKAGDRKRAREVWQRGLAIAEGRNAYIEEQLRMVLRQFG